MKAVSQDDRAAPRARNRSSPELPTETRPIKGFVDEDSDDSPIGAGTRALVQRPAVVAALVVWCLALLGAGAAVSALRGEVDGHVPPFLIPADSDVLAATTCLLSVLLVPWALLAWKQLRPRRCRWGVADAAAVLCMWFAGSFGAYSLLSARDKATSTLTIVGTSIFGVVGLSAVVLLLVRCAVAIAVCAAPHRHLWRWEPCAARLAMLLLSALALVSGFRPAVVQEVDLHVSGLADALDGYTLCMISDLHAGPTTGVDRIIEITQQLKTLHCTAIVFNGDMAEGTVVQRGEEMEDLATLTAPDGVYYVPGNHEFYNFAAPGGGRSQAVAWTRWWEAHGVRSLNNTYVRLPRVKGALEDGAGDSFVLAGIDDPLGFPNLSAALPPADAATAQRPPVVLAAHRPWPQAEQASSSGVAAQISGHTHGGQMWPVHVPAAQASHGLLSGLYDVGGMPLYVSDGTVGSYMTRLRLLTQAEITRVRLRSRPQPGQGLRQADVGMTLSKLYLLVVALGVVAMVKTHFEHHGSVRGPRVLEAEGP